MMKPARYCSGPCAVNRARGLRRFEQLGAVFDAFRCERCIQHRIRVPGCEGHSDHDRPRDRDPVIISTCRLTSSRTRRASCMCSPRREGESRR